MARNRDQEAERSFRTWDIFSSRLPAWAEGPLPSQNPANELPDTHSLSVIDTTKQGERWSEARVATFSSPELRRAYREMYEHTRPEDRGDPYFVLLEGLADYVA